MNEPTDRDLLIEVCTDVKHIVGRIPIIERHMEEHSEHDNTRFEQINNQLSFWRGGLAIVAFFLLVVGAALADHLLGGK